MLKRAERIEGEEADLYRLVRRRKTGTACAENLKTCEDCGEETRAASLKASDARCSLGKKEAV